MLNRYGEMEHKKDGADTFCPFIENPDTSCYCINMNEMKLNLSMRFCLKDYKRCRIYRRRFLQGIFVPDENL